MVARRGQRAPSLAHGQHFLKSSSIVRRLIAGASISKRDLVLDLGAGRGIITMELARTGARVIAVELDLSLVAFLERRFSAFRGVEVVSADILDFDLPSSPFKIVANLPFSTTSATLRRLLEPRSRLESARLIVQKGAALKRIKRKGNLMNALTTPWFSMTKDIDVPRSSFAPAPNVDCAILGISRRRPSLLDVEDQWAYQQFLQEAFRFAQLPLSKSLGETYGGQNAKSALNKLGVNGATAMNLTAEEWAKLFKSLKRE